MHFKRKKIGPPNQLSIGTARKKRKKKSTTKQELKFLKKRRLEDTDTTKEL